MFLILFINLLNILKPCLLSTNQTVMGSHFLWTFHPSWSSVEDCCTIEISIIFFLFRCVSDLDIDIHLDSECSNNDTCCSLFIDSIHKYSNEGWVKVMNFWAKKVSCSLCKVTTCRFVWNGWNNILRYWDFFYHCCRLTKHDWKK